jgi:DNA-binding response OmpR family regulator
MTASQEPLLQTANEAPLLLVIDDEIELQNLLSLKFSKYGFKVDVASDRQRAEELMMRTSYSAIVCDLNLAGKMEGERIYQLVKMKNIESTFIAVTGFAQDSPEVKAALSSGMRFVFSKPLRMKSILELIAQPR